jgi:hypothetical protein
MTTATDRQYILNRETGRIELRFSKEEYQNLPSDQKAELKRFFNFSRYASAWVSKSKNDHYSAIRTAKNLGFSDGGKIGKRLSYAEELESKAQKAEARAERYEQYAENAELRAVKLQSEFNELRKDWSWLTQPNINSSKGRAFTRQREKVLDRYHKGFEEYRKSEYFRERAAVAQVTASNVQLNNRAYLSNRIEESSKRIRDLERAIVKAEERQNERWLDDLLEKMEYEIDKLAFFQNALDELGGIQYNKDNLKVGYEVKIRGRWYIVVKTNPKTVEVQSPHAPFTLKYSYAEIQEVKVPEGWVEPKEELNNPFRVGDVVVQIFHKGSSREFIYRAFQVIKTTSKSVNIKQIKIEDEKPLRDNFVNDQTLQRRVTKNRDGEYVVNYDNSYLYKYND